MGLATPSAKPGETKPDFRAQLARSWALLLARLYECLPLKCPKCGEPMRIIVFVLDAPTIERILDHIGEPTQPPAVVPARPPPRDGWRRLSAAAQNGLRAGRKLSSVAIAAPSAHPR
jgi:hypothetical protein